MPYDTSKSFLDNVRNLFGKRGVQLPTPNWDDFIVVEQGTEFTENNWKLPPGSVHKTLVDKNGGPLRLIAQSRTAGTKEGEFVTSRTWCNDRINQDSYNGQYSYTAKSDAHRIIVRSSLVLRAGYVPLAELAPDSLFTSAVCTDETAVPAEAPFDTLYLRVTRTWEMMGTLSEQDQWNRRDALPYLTATYPKTTRVYRFPANNDPIAAGALTIGTSTDSSGTGAVLTSIARQDESKRVRVYTCIFDSFPTSAQIAGLTNIGSLGVAVTYPYIDTNSPRITWTYLAKDAASQKVAPLSPCPIPGYTSAVLVNQSFDPTTIDGAPVYGGTVTRVYEVIPTIAQQAADGGVASVGGLKLSIEYPYGDTAFPVLSIVVSILNDFYAPLAVNSACPVPGYTTLILTDEKRTPDNTDPVKTTLTLEYQILPGCIISSTDAQRLPRTLTAIPPFYLNGDLLTTTVQLLPYLTAGVPTVADTTSLTLLASKIEAHGKWYVTKTNVSRANPTLPILYLPKQVDGADGADGYTYKQVVQVAPSGNDATDAANLKVAVNTAITVMYAQAGNVWDYDTNPISPTATELTYTLVNAFPLRAGQDFDARLGTYLPFTEQIMTATQAAAVMGNPNTKITPVPGQDNLVRVRVDTPPTAYLDAFVRSSVKKINFSAPDVLVDLRFNMSTGTGVGSNTENGVAQSVGSSGSLSLNISNSSEGSASLLPDLTPIWSSHPRTGFVGQEFIFYAPYNQTQAQLLTRAAMLAGTGTILPEPIFAPRPLVFGLYGGKSAVRASATARYSVALSSSQASKATSAGTGYSEDQSLTVRTLEVRESLHGAITISGSTIFVATASASTSATLVDANLGINISETSNRQLQVVAGVTPGSVPATTYTSIPTGGLYAMDITVADSEFYSRAIVRVLVLDFSVFAGAVTGAGALVGNNTTPTGSTPPRLPEPPSGLYALPFSNYVRFGWNYPAGSTGFGVGTYRVYRATGSLTAPFGLLGTAYAVYGNNFYEDGTVVSGTTYFYKVIANNGYGDSDPSVIIPGSLSTTIQNPGMYARLTAQPSTAIPGPVSGLTVAPATSGTGLSISWTDNEPNLHGFNILRSTSGSGPFTAVNPTPIDPILRTYQDTTTTVGTTYYYQVVALNTIGPSSPSVVQSGVPTS